jgi:UDP-N-acetylmuramoyl-tripeptide--D-alanyl-D-alanine ligase
MRRVWRASESAAKSSPITGSAGKTTTKEFVARGTRRDEKVHRTSGNLNNELGVPLSLLSCPDDAQAAVFELGMNGPGQIAFLARASPDPDVALVTNVLPVHSNSSTRSTASRRPRESSSRCYVRTRSSVVNLDDVNVAVQAARHAGPRVTYRTVESADLKLESSRRSLSFPAPAYPSTTRDARTRVTLKIGGAHAAQRRLRGGGGRRGVRRSARTGARGDGERRARRGRGRMHAASDGVVVVDDTYNSNPEALASVLGTLSRQRAVRPTRPRHGDMLELDRNRPASTETPASLRPIGRRVARRRGTALAARGRAAGTRASRPSRATRHRPASSLVPGLIAAGRSRAWSRVPEA